MDLDIRTLLVVVTFSAAVQTAVMLYVWRTQLPERSVGLMAFSFASIAVGTVLISSRPMLPPILTVVVGNTGVIGGLAICSLAICDFARKRLSVAFPIWFAGFTAAMLAIFTFGRPEIGVRVVLISLLIPLSLAPGILALYDVPSGPLRRTHWPLCGVLAVTGLVNVIRGFLTAIGGTNPDFLVGSLLSSVWLLISFASINFIGVGLILMINQRLRLELDGRASSDEMPRAHTDQTFERSAESQSAPVAKSKTFSPG